MPVTPGTDELTELEQLAIDAATEAGRFILDERPAQLRVAETKSSATDVVTVMDQQAEQMLRQRITAARPHDAIVGEEGGRQGRGVRRHLADRPDRRHGQLPLRHPGVLRLGRRGHRRRVHAGRVAAGRRGGLQPQHR